MFTSTALQHRYPKSRQLRPIVIWGWVYLYDEALGRLDFSLIPRILWVSLLLVSLATLLSSLSILYHKNYLLERVRSQGRADVLLWVLISTHQEALLPQMWFELRFILLRIRRIYNLDQWVSMPRCSFRSIESGQFHVHLTTLPQSHPASSDQRYPHHPTAPISAKSLAFDSWKLLISDIVTYSICRDFDKRWHTRHRERCLSPRVVCLSPSKPPH
jgi:hypothetical protein